MGRIHVLPEHVANKIAAGEVVERPASVVKELLENALDAGATRIKVNIEAGGKKLIQITDNGCGMVRDDAMLAFERHATSKIKDAEDLLSVATLGFRGEALPSDAHAGERIVLWVIEREQLRLAGIRNRHGGDQLFKCRTRSALRASSTSPRKSASRPKVSRSKNRPWDRPSEA